MAERICPLCGCTAVEGGVLYCANCLDYTDIIPVSRLHRGENW
ncbi:hypothetical protein ES703_10917 [subsurface metagenome]